MTTLPILEWRDVFQEIGEHYPHIAGDILLLWYSTGRDIPSCIMTAALDYKANRIDGKRVNVAVYSFDENIDSSANVDDFDVIDNDSADILETLTHETPAMSVLKTIRDEFGAQSKHLTVAAHLSQGMTHEEIGATMGISRAYVSKMVVEIRELFV